MSVLPFWRPVSLPHQGGDTVQGESSALRRKPDPNRLWGIKPEMDLVPCQVADSNPVLLANLLCLEWAF